MAAARKLAQSVAPSESLILDEVSDYSDLAVAFYSALPEQRLARRRWANFEKQLSEMSGARWLLLAKDGKLAAEAGISPGDDTVTWRGSVFQRTFSDGPIHIYRRNP